MSRIIKLLKGSKLTDKDRASIIIRNYIQSLDVKVISNSLAIKQHFLRVTILIYTSVYNKAWIVYPQPRREFEEIIKLVEYNEDEVVLFLKHHCWKYRKRLNSEIKIFCDELLK